MVAKLWFAAATLGLVALASGSQLRKKPVTPQEPAWKDIVQSLAAHDFSGGDDKDLEEMETTIEDLVTKSDDPATKLAVKQLNHLIEKTLLPTKVHQQKIDQNRLDTYAKALNRCDLDKKAKRDMNVHEDLDTVEDHQDDYKKKRAKHGMCLDVLEGKEMVKDAHCSSVPDYKDVCHCDARMVEFFGQRDKNCANEPAIPDDKQECCDKYYEHERHKHHCESVSMDAQYAEKQHKIIMGKLCKDYEACYKNRVVNYEKAVDLAKVKDTQHSWNYLYRIQCLVGEFEKGKVSKAAAQACKEKKYDVKGLKYPEVMPKEECKVEVDQWAKVSTDPNEKIQM